MLRADSMEDPSMFFDHGDGDADDNDPFSITFESLIKILDEDPSPSPSLPSGTLNGFNSSKLTDVHVNFENALESQFESKPVMADFEQLGSSQWDSSTWNIYHPSLNDNGKLHASQAVDSRDSSLFREIHTPDFLTHLEDNTCLMDPVGSSFDGRITANSGYHYLQNNLPTYALSSETTESQCAGFINDHSQQNLPGCSASSETMELIYSQCPDLLNDICFDRRQERCSQMGGETSLHTGERESMSNLTNFMLQDGVIDCSHVTSMERSGLSDRMHGTVNPESQERNLTALFLMSSSLDPHAEVSNSEATDIIYKTGDSCLTLAREPSANAENCSRKILSGQPFQPFLSPENKDKEDVQENRLHLLQGSCRTSGVKLVKQEESPGASETEVSEVEDIRCSEQSYCEGYLFSQKNGSRCGGMSFKSESSSDSSPVPPSRKFTPGNVDSSNISKQMAPKIGSPNKKQKIVLPVKREVQMPKHHDIPKSGNDSVQKKPSRSSFSVDDDADICILDDISDPARPPPPPVHIKSHPMMPRRPVVIDPHCHGSGVVRLLADDARLTAFQDFSPPTCEASPPDGLLAVPLLRHQKIALAWMVQKETTTLNCCGGILADDQGLGKTISTIALILTERSPSSRSCSVTYKPGALEPLYLDEDVDASEVKNIKQPRYSTPMIMGAPIKKENIVTAVKGRPAAGTLVVCPTSILRQWAEELQNKVTSQAKLSFLIYHGSNRTKDPNELAKYDVVLTTYAIVSMEVPKQPLVDKSDEEGKVDVSFPSTGVIASKKRKASSSSDTKNKSAMLESAARPLGRVGWFRVILDEAQSIKNHRTQVARACWGLRAKRRWCLSGTPIQNAIDDLYSYFRFLRYDPFDVYKSFCSAIKTPITRNPTNGYRKLQLVLKMIMLRRTKGTLIEGKPIITLPPKTITLKKIDFSEGERAFYSTLEDKSREQFKEYAAAGTVKQNYVNILLMLLRLRQACDHPHLVKGYDSSSILRSSMEMAKKLPRDKQIDLLSCLEASLAICTICNDSPEDAVVTICGHVFCNQCICEHLTGDDNFCPSTHCKVRLTIASVFSQGTLRSCLSGLNDDCSYGKSDPHLINTPKTCQDSSSDSSKIKAAVEILRSLPKSQHPSSISIVSTGSSQNTVKTLSTSCSMGSSEEQHLGSEKAIVFSQWTRMLDLLETPLKASCVQYRRLDGTMSLAARDKAVKDFNTLPEVTVMIMSLKAASLGLNMVAACHVLLLDLWWNPTTEDQAIDRAHRIGQTRPVTVSRLTVKDTVEDRILALQEKKREMVASAFGEDESGGRDRDARLTVEELNYLFMV